MDCGRLIRGLQSLLVPSLFVLLCSPCATAAAQEVHISPNGRTNVTTHFANSTVEVVLNTHEIQNGTPANPVKPQDSSCTMSRHPCIVLDSLAVSVNGKPLFVARSVFCDLADVGTAELNHRGDAWELTLVGGDASEAYSVMIEFTNKFIRHRTLLDLESGQKVQETTYYQVVLD